MCIRDSPCVDPNALELELESEPVLPTAGWNLDLKQGIMVAYEYMALAIASHGDAPKLQDHHHTIETVVRFMMGDLFEWSSEDEEHALIMQRLMVQPSHTKDPDSSLLDMMHQMHSLLEASPWEQGLWEEFADFGSWVERRVNFLVYALQTALKMYKHARESQPPDCLKKPQCLKGLTSSATQLIEVCWNADERFNGFDDEAFQLQLHTSRQSFEDSAESCFQLLQVYYIGASYPGDCYRFQAEFPVNCMVYEQMIYLLYENGEDEQGEMVEEADDVIEAYMKAVCPQLGINKVLHHLCHARVELTQFKTYRTPLFICQMLCHLKLAVKSSGKSGTDERSRIIAELYTKHVTTELVQEVLLILSSSEADLEELEWDLNDVQQVLEEYLKFAEKIPNHILGRDQPYSRARERDVMMGYAAVRVFDLSKKQAAEEAIEITADQTMHDVEVINASVLVEILEENLSAYSSTELFRHISGESALAFVTVVAQEVHKYIKEREIFFEIQDPSKSLPQQFSVHNEELLHLLRKQQKLQETLKRILDRLNIRGEASLGLGLVEWSRLMLEDFINVEASKLLHIITRAFEEDSWEPMRNHMYSSSVQDVFQFLIGSLEHYYGVQLPQCIWDSTRFESDVLLEGVKLYCDNVQAMMGFVEDPPRYPFKRNWPKSQECLVGMKYYRIKVGEEEDDDCAIQPASHSWQEFSEEETEVQIQQLVLCVNNLQRALDIIPDLREIAEHKCFDTVKAFPGDQDLKAYAEMRIELHKAAAKNADADSSAFAAAQDMVHDALEHVIRMLARRIVFYDLSEHFQALYRDNGEDGFRLQETNFSAVVEEALNESLATYFPRLDQPTILVFLEELLHAVIWQMRNALFYGGPDRLFQASDLNVIQHDIQQIRRFFEQTDDNEDGIEKEVVGPPINQLHQEIMNVMDQSTETLITRHKAAAAQSDPSEQEELLAHVILHRRGPDAKAYYSAVLKKSYYQNEGYAVYFSKGK
eukprot:TRINITY_DN18997_c0_g1_i3.p1 TRINITY_DN18997_c0_g1~~TRINITY_DN18997_c0_g1_i3.p1  ORF type:complete len:990 (+),score=298.67 TRINITY_DN18997_c0_g1_i3:182-3151(+)